MSENLEVKVLTQADTAPVEKYNAALQGTKTATEATGHAAKEAGNLVDTFGARSSPAAHALHGLEMAAHGGAHGILGIGIAWKAVTHAFASNPFTAILVVLFALGPVLKELAEKFHLLGEGEKKAGEEAERARAKIDEMLATSAKLSEQRFELFKGNIDDITRKFKEVREEIDRVQAAADKLDDAEMAAQLAENKVQPGLTDEQRSQNDLTIRRGFQFQKRDRAENVRQEKERLAAQEAATTEVNESLAAKSYGELQRGIDERKNAREDAERVLTELKRQQEKTAAFVVPKEGGEPTANPEFFTRRKQIEDLQAKIDETYSSGAKEGNTRMLAELDARKKAFEAATKAANDAYEAQQKLLRGNARDRELEQKLAGPEYRQYYAEKFGIPVDPRTHSDPVYKPEIRTRDAASMREGYGADGLNRIGDKVISASDKLASSIVIDGVARATEKLAGAIESKIEIDGRKWNQVTNRLDKLEAVVRASNRGN